jgi:sarcosine oxidase delta subunit
VWTGNPHIGPHTLWLLRNTKGLYWPSWMTCEGCPKFITFDADLNHIIIKLENDETTPEEMAQAIAEARNNCPDYLGLTDYLKVN